MFHLEHLLLRLKNFENSDHIGLKALVSIALQLLLLHYLRLFNTDCAALLKNSHEVLVVMQTQLFTTVQTWNMMILGYLAATFYQSLNLKYEEI